MAHGEMQASLETCAAYFFWSFLMGLGADFWKISTAISGITESMKTKLTQQWWNITNYIYGSIVLKYNKNGGMFLHI